jgi:hypothetical protein
VHIAAIVALYLQQKYPQLPLQLDTFEKIVPSISETVVNLNVTAISSFFRNKKKRSSSLNVIYC